MKTYENVAFIPLRGGSKSIKNKNIKPINGRPLAYWSLDAAVNCSEIDCAFVSTDSKQIFDEIRKYNHSKIKIIKRSHKTSTDDASTESAMIEFANKFEFNNIVLIQATSPLINSQYLSEGLELIKNKRFDSVLSVVKQKRFIWKKNKKTVFPVNYNLSKRPRRQDFGEYYVENGSFYITRRDDLIKSGLRLNGRVGMVEMHEHSYFELDEPTDFQIVESLMKLNNNSYNELSNIKAVFTDCDGVLTDGGMYYTEFGDEFKRFNARDGMGFQLLRQNQILTGIITGENNPIVSNRAKKLKIDELSLASHDKLSILHKIIKKHNLDSSEVAYIGDDINDLAILQAVGYPVCVADSVDTIKQVCKYITKLKGGEGAVREFIDMLLKFKY